MRETVFGISRLDDQSILERPKGHPPQILTLAHQLAFLSDEYRTQLVAIIQSDPSVGNSSMSNQFEKLLVQPLRSSQLKTMIIVDALDECTDNEPEGPVASRHRRTPDAWVRLNDDNELWSEFIR
jgi:hypothetical protein